MPTPNVPAAFAVGKSDRAGRLLIWMILASIVMVVLRHV